MLQLLVKLVGIGDPTYSAQQLEMFCRTRLFRYSKSRSSNKQLRRSACRPGRKHKDVRANEDIKHENPLDIVDVLQSDSAEESEYQDETMDREAIEADIENDDEEVDDFNSSNDMLE